MKLSVFTQRLNFALMTFRLFRSASQPQASSSFGLGALIAVMLHSPWVSADVFDTWHKTSEYEIDYIIDLSVLPPNKPLNLWVPLPAENQFQKVLSRQQLPTSIAAEQSDIVDNRGNRNVQFSFTAAETMPEVLHFKYRIQRQPAQVILPSELRAMDNPKQFLAASEKIPLDGLIKSIAEEEAQGAQSRADLQRRYYDYVYDSMRYSKEGEGWGQGDAIWACQSQYGNCTDFHSLYIGLLRSQQIPARFKIGFPLSGDLEEGRHDGYHCWAETYHDVKGWLPVDASEAKKAGLPDEYYGQLPSDRIEFTQGRDIVLSDRHQGAPINYFVYPYAEIGTQSNVDPSVETLIEDLAKDPENANFEVVARLPVKLLFRRVNRKPTSADK